ncbi:hypothetical protein SH580_18985 [Coraliomargarita algicola]|uniref:Uncharacterized protein n=1 Tax=Coraliomargarita algicola TaxID=3092156 RepID=A0ABZ0RJC5_9BACT|nr:hypothetical protein [Coraliomargarita sp. J2-16]WPJ95506.1 hypothetical protein SH580_18985 [Coraliomargarita sp. J2-16]
MNESLVTTLDALLHIGAIVVFAGLIILACKLLSRGHVDAKLLTGLKIATLLVCLRVILLNTIGQILPSVSAHTQEIIVIAGLYLATFILVYKLITIPALGTALSAAAIVCVQLSLASYVPQLSLHLMPEGQRFAEYTGLANKRTKSLLTNANAFRTQAGGTAQMLIHTFQSFINSEPSTASLTKDLPKKSAPSQVATSNINDQPLTTLVFENAPTNTNRPVAQDPTAAPSYSNPAVELQLPPVTTELPLQQTPAKKFFAPQELHPIVTEQSIVLIPQGTTTAKWRAVANSIKIDALFAASEDSERATIFIQGIGLQNGDTWEHHDEDGWTYRFAFQGIKDDFITLIALERTSTANEASTTELDAPQAGTQSSGSH